MNDNEQYDNFFNTSILSYIRVIGIGKATEKIIDTINSYKYDGVSCSVICNPSEYIPADTDRMAIIVALDNEELANSIAKTYHSAGVLTLGLLKNADKNCYDSVLTESSVNCYPGIVKNLLQPIVTYGYINFDFNDLHTNIKDSSSFNTLTVNGKSIEDAAKNLCKGLDNIAVQNLDSLSLHIYFNRKRRANIKMENMVHLSNMIPSLPESLNVIWSVNFDDTLPEDIIRLTVIMSGKEL